MKRRKQLQVSYTSVLIKAFFVNYRQLNFHIVTAPVAVSEAVWWSVSVVKLLCRRNFYPADCRFDKWLSTGAYEQGSRATIEKDFLHSPNNGRSIAYT